MTVSAKAAPAKAKEAAPKAVPQAATSAAPEAKAESVVDWSNVVDKEGLYEKLHGAILAGTRATKDGRVVAPKSLGRDIFVDALTGLFKVVTGVGAIALPAGFGSIYLKGVAARKQRTPQGVTLDVPARWALRINPGVRVDEVIKKLPPPEMPVVEEEVVPATAAAVAPKKA